jgi:hypothetical protein
MGPSTPQNTRQRNRSRRPGWLLDMLAEWWLPLVDPAAYVSLRLEDFPDEESSWRKIDAGLRLRRPDLAGEMRAPQLTGLGMTFASVRPYVAGDDVRQMDWHVMARTGLPHVRQFELERQWTAYVLIDVSPSMRWGRGQMALDRAAEAASGLLYLLAEAGHRVGLGAFGDARLGERALWLPGPGGGERHRRACEHQLDALLAIYQEEPPPDQLPQSAGFSSPWTTSMEALRARLIQEEGVVFLLSDFWGFSHEAESALGALAGHRMRIRALWLTDPAEELLAGLDDTLWPLVDPESGATPVQWRSGRDKNLATALQDWEETLPKRLNRFAHWVRFPEAFDCPAILSQLLRLPLDVRVAPDLASRTGGLS